MEAKRVPSGKPAEMCREKLGRKKSTAYTRLRLPAEKGYVKNEDAVARQAARRGG